MKRRFKPKGTLPAAAALVLAAAVCFWSLHWMFTCIGSHGELRFSESRNFFGWGYTWGHTSALMWVEKGETIAVRYNVRMSEKGRVSFRLRKLRAPWELTRRGAWKTVYVTSSEAGGFSLTATETGLHELDRSESSVWKGDAAVAWAVR